MVRVVRGAIGTAVAILFGFAVPSSTAVSASSPTVRLVSTVLVPGSRVYFDGFGWPAGTQVQLQICGHNAIDGSADCAQDAVLVSAAGQLGEIGGFLPVTLPPEPCPCVVLVLTLPNIFSTTLPITLARPRIATTPPAPLPQLTVQARVTGGISLASLFGLRAHRTLALTIKNQGTVVTSAAVSAGWGRSASDLSPISAPAVPQVAPGQTARVNIPFTLAPLSVGNYLVGGSVTGGVRPVDFQVKTSTIPWGLFAVGLLLLQGALIFLRNRVRTRLARNDASNREAGLDLTGGGSQEPPGPSATDPAPPAEDADIPPVQMPSTEVPDHLDLAGIQSLPDPEVAAISRAAAQSVLKAISQQPH